MIEVVVQFNDTTANIDLPCADVHLEAQYMELHMPEDAERILFVKNVYFPDSLIVLENMFIKMDELNYLAKRLCSFDNQEFKQFEAVVKQNEMQDMKDLINLTFNLPRYTLIQDIRNMEDIGRVHILNVQGGLSEDEMENYDFVSIGKELLLSGKGQITEYGILFENEEIPFDEVYDGQVFPEYYHEDCMVTAELRYIGKSEYVYMPCDELAVTKAVKRLGATTLADCGIELRNCNVDNHFWFEFMRSLALEGKLNLANELIKTVSEFKEENDWDKLTAVIEFTGVRTNEEVIQLAKNLDSFIFVPNVDDEEELARYWLEQSEEYRLNPELEDFFLYDQFGEKLANDLKGAFAENGYVCLREGRSLDEILELDEDATMTMGGM